MRRVSSISVGEVRRVTIGYCRVREAYVKLTIKHGSGAARLFRVYTTGAGCVSFKRKTNNERICCVVD